MSGVLRRGSVPPPARPMTPTLCAEPLHQRVRYLEIGVDVLHVVVLVEGLDQLEEFLALLVVDGDRVLRLPHQRRLARLSEFRLQRLGHFAQRFFFFKQKTAYEMIW